MEDYMNVQSEALIANMSNTYNQTASNMNLSSQEYLQWRLDQAAGGVSQIYPETKIDMISEGCDDYEYVPIMRNDMKGELPVDMIWGENGAMGTICVDIPDGDYRVEKTVNGEGKPVFLHVKDKKIDEAHLHECSAYSDWSKTSSLHYFYERVSFNIDKKTVNIAMFSLKI